MSKSVVLSLKHDIRISVLNSLAALSTYVFLEQEDWFEDEPPFLRKVVRPGMRAVDIGANYGYYTLTLARAVGAEGRVWGIEPHPGCVAHLRHSLSLNRFADRAIAIPLGLADATGEGRLDLGAGSEGSRLVDGAGQGSSTVGIPLSSLDEVASRYGMERIDFVKLDVEGAEGRVLDGAAQFFRRESPLLMFESAAARDRPSSLIERLPQMGWNLYRLVPSLAVLVPYDEAEFRERPLNLFACKPERASRLAAMGALVTFDGEDPGESASQSLLDTHLRAIGLDQEADRGPIASDARLALNDWLISREPSLPVEQRYRALARSFAMLRAMIADAGPELTLAFARIALDFGARWQAAPHWRALSEGGWAGRAGGHVHPMPSAEAEARPPGIGAEDWILGHILAQCERTVRFSSYFAPAEAEARLTAMELLIPLPVEMVRRRLLIALRDGRAVTVPQRLTEPASDHLNAAYWAGLRADDA